MKPTLIMLFSTNCSDTQVHKPFGVTGLLHLFSPALWQWLIQMQRKSLRKKKESQVKMMQKVWFATAVSAKSGHRRPLYFNLCSLSQAEEQQLLQRAAENVWLSAEQTGGQSLCPLPRGEKKDSRKRFPQQGPLTTKPDFGWQEQKLVSVHQKQENKAKAAGKDRQIERQKDRQTERSVTS